MELTVKDVLNLPAFQDINFLAGSDGLARTVTGVNIVEVPTVAHWMRGGELLFSSGYAFGGDDRVGCQLLKDLNNHQIAGLILKPGEYLNSVSQAMVDCAERLGFPLLTMPEARPYSHYMDAVYTLLLNQKAKILEVSNTICNHLFNIALDDSYRPLSQFVSDSLKRPIYLLNAEGALVNGHNEDKLALTYAEAFQSITKQSLGLDGFVNEFIYKINENATRFIFVPIESVQKRVRYLVSVDNESSDRELACSVLPFVARIIQIQEMHQHSMLQREHQISGDLLGDIIETRYSDPGIIIQRGRLLQIDLTQKLVLMIINLDPNQMDYLNYSDDRQHGHFKLRSIIREAVLAVEPHVLFLDRDDSMVCLLQVEGKSLDELKRKLDFLSFVNSFLEKYALSAGISRWTDRLSGVPGMFRQAEIAVKVASAKQNINKRLIFYDDLSLFRLYPELSDSDELDSLVHDTLQPVLDYDSQNRTDYMRTLRAFYKCSGVVSHAADALYIHKNTMIKYLKKLEDIMKRDLRDYDSVAEVMFCLQYYDLLKKSD